MNNVCIHVIAVYVIAGKLGSSVASHVGGRDQETSQLDL